MNNTYPKTEKLKSKTTIDLLFSQGKSVSKYPLRLVYVPINLEKEELIKIGVSVSKKYFKKAVHRNRIKRLLREAYRLNKEIFADKFGKHSLSMIFWASKNFPQNYDEVERELLKLCESKK